MKEHGLQWNAEKKRVEKIRWRAENGERYYRIINFSYIESIREYFAVWNNRDYELYNYFRTREQAKEAAKRVKETLMKCHEEIGG